MPNTTNAQTSTSAIAAIASIFTLTMKPAGQPATTVILGAFTNFDAAAQAAADKAGVDLTFRPHVVPAAWGRRPRTVATRWSTQVYAPSRRRYTQFNITKLKVREQAPRVTRAQRQARQQAAGITVRPTGTLVARPSAR